MFDTDVPGQAYIKKLSSVTATEIVFVKHDICYKGSAVKTAYKNIGLLAFIFSVGVMSSSIRADYRIAEKEIDIEVVEKDNDNNKKVAVLKTRAERLWNSTIGKIVDAAMYVKMQTEGVYRFIMTGRVEDNMRWARYAMILSTCGGLAFSGLVAYKIYKKLRNILTACAFELNAKELEMALAVREQRRRSAVRNDLEITLH